MNGVTVRVTDRCIGCGTCLQGICFANAIRLVDGHAVIGDGCRGCGHCATVCPQQAIELTIEYNQVVESAIARISHVVDVS